MSIYTNYKIVVLNSNNEPKETIESGSEMKIHPDDTIQLIKKKFLKEYSKPIAYEEIYMFSRISREVPTESLFNSISNSGKYINRHILKQVLSNLDLDLALDKEKYSYQEFVSLMGNKNNIELEYKIPLDRKFQLNNEEQFSANPFDIILGSTDIFIDKANNPLITLDNQVLLNHNGAKFIDDTIYVCLAEDVINYCCNENGWDDYAILKMYFSRMITAYGINNQQQWLENRQNMITETGKMLNESTFQMAKIVDLFYEMGEDAYADATDVKEIEYLERGIKAITVGIVPTVAIGLPLESIFKKIHAVEMLPFIKFNPGFRRENIYRIYCDKLSKRGEKVPFMKKNIILRLANELGRKKIISFYTYDAVSEIYVDLESNGNVKIRGKWKESMNMAEIGRQLADKANPILSKINDLLAQSGHKISLLESLNQSGVIIGEVTYFWKTRVRPNTIQLNKLANCLRPIFEINDKDAKIENEEGVDLRFKRVDNYRDMDAQEIFMNEIYQKTGDVVKVKELFKEQFRASEEEAVEKIAAYFNDEFRGAEDISDSPGFPMRIRVENFNGAIFYAEIVVSKHIEYVDILNMYIEGILRITQDSTKKHLMKEIGNLCLNTKMKKREPEEYQAPIIKNIEVVQPIVLRRNLLEEEFGVLPREEAEFEEEEEEEEEPDIEIEFEEDEEEEQDGGINDSVNVDSDAFPHNDEFANIGYNFVGGANSHDEDEDEDEDKDKDEKYDESYLNGKDIGSQMDVLRRLQEKDPVLFNYKHKGINKGMFTSYARACQGSRQPMILTDDEKTKINPDSYENAIRYGSDANKQFWYICPRFWCLKTNRPISEEDAKSGKCGKILPKDATHIKPGHYVYEIDRKGHTTPGFFKENERHPQGFCLPCCFKKSADNEAFKKRREECMRNDDANALKPDAEEEEGEAEAEAEAEAEEANQQKKLVINTNAKYIRNIQKFPLEPQRWGFLPISIQRMLQIKSNMSNNVLSSNKKSMLRYGVELSETKSFIACIANVYAAEEQCPSIAEMCDIIARAVSIDIFVQAHNGSLPSMFQPKQYDYADIDYTKYDDSKFIQSIQFGDDAQEDFMNDTIAAYENFLHFLINPESIIDYTYLWDIISMPNPLLFKRGINLAILEIPDNDATEHVEVVCPTAAYSSAIYSAKKDTLILTKRNSESNEEITYFEPVYLYDKKQITRTFSANTQIKPIQHILQVIRNFSQKKCAPLKSMPKEYSFERNKSAIQIRDICTKYDIDLLAQVLNFQGKIVAFLVKRKQNPKTPKGWISDAPIYLPCAPSAMMPDIENVKYINDDIWQNYITTRDALLQLSILTEGNLLCKPVIKVIDDELIVGMLTETNQFVMINPPVENNFGDGLQELKDTNYIMADIDLANGRKIDKVRERTVKMIRLEKYFYQVFRTTLRILLKESLAEKTDLMKEIENLTHANYTMQLTKIQELLHRIMDSYVEFQIYDESILLALNEISDCFSQDSDTKPYCIFKSDVRKILIPERNLISGKPNNRIYFMRLADELLRYKRIRSIIFDKNAFVLETDEYQLNVDEIILLEYMMAEYFEKDLIPAMKIKDAHISYEFANPYKTTKYSNEVKLAEQEKVEREPVKEEADETQPKEPLPKEPLTEEEDKVETESKPVDEPSEEELKLECVKETRPVVGNATNIWKQYFPKSTKEIELNPSVNCTYYPILIIYKNINDGKIITMEQLKKILVRTYNKFSKYEEKILYLLSLQGKRDMMLKIAKKETTMEQTIMSGIYPLSNLDYWILCEVLNLPVILFTSMKNIKHLLKDESWLRLGENNNYKKREYYFIRAPTEKDSKRGVNEIHAYSMITYGSKMGITMEQMPEFQEQYADAVDEERVNLIDLESYLSGDYI